ncbi:MAG TPA: aminoglycoside phosphotransferase family protein, partial [Corynebacterium urealyticum]|nr:aminoglycoside phosphotransferase family protein [Corynebacterium urealyticum]
MTEQQDGFSSGNFQPIGKLSAEDIRTGNIDRAEVAHDYTRENLRPETLPIFIKLIWQDLAWENILLPKQGMDHAVILLEGVRSDEGEFADMVPNRVIVRAPYTEAYRLQASRESGVIAALGHRSNARLPQTVRQAHVPRRFTGNQRRIRVTLLSVIDGTPLDANVWQQMNAEQQELVVEQLGSLLAAMHTMNSSLPPASNLESWWADGPGQSDATGVHEVGGVPISPATEGEAHELNYTERTLPGKHEVMRRRMVEVLKPELSAA